MTVRKPPEARARGKRTRDLAAVPSVVELPPGPPASRHWSPAVVEQWRDFWCSPLADPRIVTLADHAALYRLFDFRQRLIEALERFDQEPESEGSTGQMVLSPWAAEVHRLDAVVSRLEDRFGCTPASRLKLGVSVAQTQAAAARAARPSSGKYSHLRNEGHAVETSTSG